MTVRHREADFRVTECGTYHNWIFGDSYQCMTHGQNLVCDDVIDNWEGVNPFLATDVTNRYGSFTGTSPDGLRWCNAYPMTFRPGAPSPTLVYPNYTSLDLSNKAWEILAKTNPNLPLVNLPTFIGELKDLPSLVEGWGRGLLKAIAQGYLSWRWAIRPMISDLRKLMTFVDAVNQRLTYLLRLRDGKPMHKRCVLGQGMKNSAPTFATWHSNGPFVQGWRHVVTSYNEWATVQWKLDPACAIPTLGYGELDKLARRLTLGLTYSGALSTLWELTPWSWLADWFGSFGTFVAATNNSVPLLYDKMCLMRTRRTSVRWYNWTNSTPWYVLSTLPTELSIIKERQIVYPLLPFVVPQIPVLTTGQWSILASLAVLKLK
jgi:hypothetical protein